MPTEPANNSQDHFDQDRFDQPLWWLRANGHDLAGVTGSERRALIAIAWCWDIYSVSSDQKSVLDAVRALLRAVQQKHHPLVRELIARSLDWSDRGPVWQKLHAPAR